MFEFWRNWRKSAAEKQQEAINAYLDNALSPVARQRFEQEMAQDATLQQEVESLQVLRSQLRQLPRRPVPRNFMLDPAKYGRPAPQPLFQFYPMLRTAMVLTGIFLMIAVGASLFTVGGTLQELAFQPQTQVVEVEVTRVVTETVVTEGESIEVTRVVVEEVMEEAAADAMEELEAAPAAELMAEEAETAVLEEAPAEESMAEEPAAAAAAASEPAAEDGANDERSETNETGGALAQEPPAATIMPTPTQAATSTAVPTNTAAPTPTPSELPRLTATELPDRIAESDSDAATKAAATAVPAPTSSTRQVPPNLLTMLFAALVILFGLLLAATLWVRRQL